MIVRSGDTMVMATAVITDSARPGQNFFPLTVDYREKFSSGGKIPGGFIKREGRLNDKEILTSRLVDRAIRPLFPEGYRNEVQLIGSVISADNENDGDMLFGLGASASLMLSGAPFDGPIAEVRVGRIDGTFVINPTIDQLKSSDINLVVAGKMDAIMMVEGEMEECSEQDVVHALATAHQVIKKICETQLELINEYESVHAPIEPQQYEVDSPDPEIVTRVRDLLGSKIDAHIRAPYDKKRFYGGLSEIVDEAVETLTSDLSEQDESFEVQVRSAASIVSRDVMREMVLADHKRIDGRDPESVRPIWCEAGYLPRVHGSAIFTRGETQVMASVTLGTTRDQQPVDQIFDQQDKHFFLHYEFPPFSTGEVKFLRGASRREIGHGYLSERALQGMIPSQEDFPYTIRINADVLESNGSSSMASVCSGSMALMDAGVPIQKAVAGVAMGMIADETRHVVLTDILGTEDHLGDMDFKVTGTRDGITACQMDIKIHGLSMDLMLQALMQARHARLHILDVMDQTLDAPRDNMSSHAPRLTQITIDSELIGAVIGPGGKTVRGIQADTGVVIEIEEKDNLGYVTIAGSDESSVDAAIEIIRSLVVMPQVGEEYEGTVRSVTDIGAIVEILPGKEGMVHKSELSWEWVNSPRDFVQVGDKLRVRLMEIRDRGRLRLSHKVTVARPAHTRQGGDRASRSGGHPSHRGGKGRHRGSRRSH